MYLIQNKSETVSELINIINVAIILQIVSQLQFIVTNQTEYSPLCNI